MSTHLRRLAPADVAPRRGGAVPAEALAVAQQIVGAIEQDGEAALRRWAERLGDLAPGAPLVLGRAACDQALARLPAATVALLGRTAERIARFAMAQRQSLLPLDVAVPGGRAGHDVVPVDAAGCYAPGGRYPLPSSVLMTAVTARVAGVRDIVVASPRPDDVTLAAAAIAGATRVLPVGGAQAIAAMAFGVAVPACDVIAGPGNRYVSAAKQLLAGRARIDMVAGPSELLIVADDTADPALIAADLLAQAEHDPDAVPMLVAIGDGLAAAVERELDRQLATLPTAAIARRALPNGCAVCVHDVEQALEIADRLAAEHVQVMTANAAAVAARLRHGGAVFVGPASAEVFGDYGAGPNHVLPTGGVGRARGGLSVFDFVRVRTWLRIDEGDGALLADARDLARLEGLEAHARAAEVRAGAARPAGRAAGPRSDAADGPAR